MRGDIKQRSCRWLPLKRHESSGVDRSSRTLDLVRVEKETKAIAKRTSVSSDVSSTSFVFRRVCVSARRPDAVPFGSWSRCSRATCLRNSLIRWCIGRSNTHRACTASFISAIIWQRLSLPSSRPCKERAADEEVVTVDPEIKEGQSVHIAEGPFQGLEPVVTQVLSARERVKVLLEFLGPPVELRNFDAKGSPSEALILSV